MSEIATGCTGELLPLLDSYRTPGAAAHIGADDLVWYSRTVRSIAQTQSRDGRAADVRAWATETGDGLLRASALLDSANGLYREPAKAAKSPSAK